ncbi:MAG: GSCFA domain-containing protein [Robiginitalea sp.]|uniref:GSCFA domain-containing protein n=1 Tax=Robiginitalea sp. TaxID=1902411 RepID=UPI003C75C796
MKWRTKVEIGQGADPIDYRDEVLVLGSCFADHLGDKLAYYQFRHLANPFGVLFHPIPLGHLIERAVEGRRFREDDLFEREGLWRCLEVHSRAAGSSKDATLKGMNETLNTFQKSLAQASHIVLTLGTAFAFRNLDTDLLVANCHKLPQQQFHRELTPVAELVRSLGHTIAVIRKNNPECQILLTVSPVRHVRDGLVENQRSKAHLLAAVHQVVEGVNIHYFPAYELLMDELRDYRFYKRDLIHPTEQAVDFVWEKFIEAWVDPGVIPVMKRVAGVRKQLAHRNARAAGSSRVAPGEPLKQKVEALSAEFPFIHFEL